MPPTQKHMEISLIRTGKDFRELHEWLNSKNNHETHNIVNIPRFIPIVRKKFGKKGVEEYLYHLKEDYEQTTASKIFKRIKKLKFW